MSLQDNKSKDGMMILLTILIYGIVSFLTWILDLIMGESNE